MIIGVVTLMALAAASTARADIKLAYVDIQRALNDCRNGKSAKTEFRGRLERVQSQLQGEQSEVQRLKDELEKKGPLMQPDQRQSLEQQYSRKLRDFQDDYKSTRETMQEKDNEITGAIVRDLATIVRQIGQKNGYTMVMEKGNLLWAVPSVDITDDVIRDYDATGAKAGTLGGAAGAPPAGGGSAFGSGSRSNPLSGPAPSGAGPSAPEPSDSGRSTISK
ncbi:MAG TPA: OmpH family outer membrane protein [Candidatus Binataceae bacterium]|nr:OmpH family outer membrane protein [Candidatus Binataceae bacterium]